MVSEAEVIKHISAREAMHLILKGAILTDVRLEYELSRLFDVEGVIYLPYNELTDLMHLLPKDVDLIIADAVGLRSKEVCRLLLKSGYTRIYNLAGGVVDWERTGFPVTKDKSRLLSGSCLCQLKFRNKKS